MSFEYRLGLPLMDAYWPLFLSTGWNSKYQAIPADLEKALKNSWFMVSAYEGERLVGFGRVVADIPLHAMIYDLIVDPHFQKQGIGSAILDRLVQKCLDHNIVDIQLFSAVGKKAFYEKHGFTARPEDGPGMQYARK